MNKVLVKLYVPVFEEQYDVWIPLNNKIYYVTNMLVRAVNEFSGGYYRPSRKPILYDRLSADAYNINLNVKDAGIRNGTEIVII